MTNQGVVASDGLEVVTSDDLELGSGANTSPDSRLRHWPPRRHVHSGTPHAMRPLVWSEDFLHYAVSIVLVGIALVVLFHSVFQAFHDGFANTQTSHPFGLIIPDLIDSVLTVIIVLEIFTTVLSHFRDAGLQLQPFLIIGIVSAVRHILVVGAKSSLDSKSLRGIAFQNSMIELGVNVGVAIVLVIALVLVNRSGIRRAEH